MHTRQEPASSSAGRGRPRSAVRARGASATPGPGAPPRLGSARCPCAGECPRCRGASPEGVGPGRALDAGVRGRMERGLGEALGGVRVHTGPASAEAARLLGARAFTTGRDIHFARGEYAPHTARGVRLIAHEISHVVQQRRGAPSDGAAGYAAAERESRRAAGTLAAGGAARLAERSAGLVQRQDATERTPLTSSPEFQLRLDPELEAFAMRHYLRWWVGSALTGGGPAPDAEGAPAAAGAATPLLPTLDSMPLSPDFFRPIPPWSVPDPDLGAILGPYGTRGVPYGARDVDAALQVYRQNWRIVGLMPDLRELAPSFLRPLIPADWRRSMAGAFTAATLNAQLRGDHPTPIEAADRFFLNMTGVSTTYLPIPGLSW